LGQVLTQWAHALKKYKERDGQIFSHFTANPNRNPKKHQSAAWPHVNDTSLLTRVIRVTAATITKVQFFPT